MLALLCVFYVKPWGACRCHCLDSPLRRVQSEAFHTTRSPGAMSWSRCMYLSRCILLVVATQMIFLIGSTPQKIGGKMRTYFFDLRIFFSKMGWMEPTKQWRWQFFFCTFEFDHVKPWPLGGFADYQHFSNQLRRLLEEKVSAGAALFFDSFVVSTVIGPLPTKYGILLNIAEVLFGFRRLYCNRKNPLEATLWWFCIGVSGFFYLI